MRGLVQRVQSSILQDFIKTTVVAKAYGIGKVLHLAVYFIANAMK